MRQISHPQIRVLDSMEMVYHCKGCGTVVISKGVVHLRCACPLGNVEEMVCQEQVNAIANILRGGGSKRQRKARR